MMRGNQLKGCVDMQTCEGYNTLKNKIKIKTIIITHSEYLKIQINV